MEKSNAATVALCDTGPLIHRDELESLELLADFRVWVPDAVWQLEEVITRVQQEYGVDPFC